MSPVPTQLSSVEAESQRTQDRATERASRCVSPNPTVESVNERDGALLSAVGNTEVLANSITINPDYLCPLAQMIPENSVIFGDTFFERTFC